MTDSPYNRTVIYPLEKPLADDMNQQFSQGDRTVRDTLFRMLNGGQGFLDGSLEVLASSPAGMSVLLKAGVGYQDAPTDVPTSINGVAGLNDLSRYKPIILLNDLTVAVPAAPGANSRIDLLEVRYNRQVNNPQSRNFLDPSTNSFSPSTISKTLDFNVDGTLAYYTAAQTPTTALAYKSGVVAGSPVAPTVDTGYLALATITVGTSVVVINTANISMLLRAVIGGKLYLGRQLIAASGTYTPTPGTRRVVARVCGGGGGGGGAQGGANKAVASGGSSGVMITTPPILGAPLITGGAVVIGTGGAGGASTPTSGGNGTLSSVVINGATYTGAGGGGGILCNSLGVPVATFGGAPLAGSTAAMEIYNADFGQPGIGAGNAGSDSHFGGCGGSGALGIGGLGAQSSQAGLPGNGYGAGGGGAAASGGGFAGGAGIGGVVIIDEWM